MIPDFIRNLEIRLKEKLPGQVSQNKMAPAVKQYYGNSLNTGKAAVLILVFPNNGELSTILIKRTEYPGPHSGQISFPGGKTEKTDDSQITTALRETGEETGIDTGRIYILGTLTPLYIPVSNLEVLPVIGYYDTLPEFKINPAEVEYLIHIPLKHLTGDKLITEKTLRIRNKLIRAPGYSIKNEYIWGATAMIISEFIEVTANAFAANQ